MTGRSVQTAGAVLTCVALALIARPGTRSTSSSMERAELVAAARDFRPFEGRLSGGFRWQPKASPNRGAAPPAPALQIAAARLELMRDARGSAAALAAYGAGQAMVGRYDDAIAALEEATAMDARAAWLSDLAAVYIARSAALDRALDLPYAVEASSRAIEVDPVLPEARFNRALALTTLGLTVAAADEWETYLTLEDGRDWQAEAKTRRDALAAPAPRSDAQRLREDLFDRVLPHWAAAGNADVTAQARTALDAFAAVSGDRALADAAANLLSRSDTQAREGLVYYGQARALYNEGRYDDSRRAFAESRGRLRRHALIAAWSTLHIGIVDYLSGKSETAAVSFAGLDAKYGNRSPALAGHIRWMAGMIQVLRGRHTEALDTYDAAVGAFETAREPVNAEFVRGLIAEDYDWLGRPADAWNARLGALRYATRQGTLLSTASSARTNGWNHLAADVQRQSAERAQLSGRTPAKVDALRDLALTAGAAGDRAKAASLIREAADLIAGDGDQARARPRAELDLARAHCGCVAPTEALSAANRAVEYFMTTAAARKLPEAHLARAAAHRANGNIALARQDLERGIALIEREAALAPILATSGMARELRALTDALISLERAEGNDLAALAAADRGRSTRGSMQGKPTSARELAGLVADFPADAEALYYHLTDTDLLIWSLTRGSLTLVSRPERAASLARRVRAFTTNPLNRSLGGDLRAALLPTAGRRRLILFPDGPLHLLPFAALPGVRSPYLLEEQEITHASRLSALSEPPERPPVMSLSVIANPRIDRRLFPDLPDLPGAAREAASIGSAYERYQVIAGRDATHTALIATLDGSDVVHFAGHAVVNEVDGSRSQLVLADAAEAPLRAQNLAGVRARRARLVVLAACSAASGHVTTSEGPSSLAHALLSSGVESVVASLWPVSDELSLTLFTAFHHSYASSEDASEALRAGQLAVLRAHRGATIDPRSWAGFIVIRGAAQR